MLPTSTVSRSLLYISRFPLCLSQSPLCLSRSPLHMSKPVSSISIPVKILSCSAFQGFYIPLTMAYIGTVCAAFKCNTYFKGLHGPLINKCLTRSNFQGLYAPLLKAFMFCYLKAYFSRLVLCRFLGLTSSAFHV